jgi:hypothetical protein
MHLKLWWLYRYDLAYTRMFVVLVVLYYMYSAVPTYVMVPQWRKCSYKTNELAEEMLLFRKWNRACMQ